MKIRLQEHTYTLESIEKLSDSHSYYKGLVDFMINWHLGDASFLFHTSGSTGTAKEIQISRNQILASVKATQDKLNLVKGEKALMCLNPDFIASKMMAARAISVGMDLIITTPSSSPLKLLETTIDFGSFVPFQIYKMIRNGSISKLGQIKNVLIGGAQLDPWAVDILSQFKNNIYLTYGMTETVSHIALKKITGDDAKGLYSTMKGVDIEIDDRSCLCISGAVTNHNLIVTNDVVQLKSKNTFEWLGRYDNIINSGGIKINPEKLEFLIAPSILDNNFFVGGILDHELGQKCILVVEGKINLESFISIQKELLKSLPKHYIPKEVVSLDSFQYTQNGKLKRNDTLALITG